MWTGSRWAARSLPTIRARIPLVTVRDDGGNADGLGNFDRSIGVNVYGWSRQAEKPCKDLARRVYAALTEHPAIALAKDSPGSSAWTIPRATALPGVRRFRHRALLPDRRIFDGWRTLTNPLTVFLDPACVAGSFHFERTWNDSRQPGQATLILSRTYSHRKSSSPPMWQARR